MVSIRSKLLLLVLLAMIPALGFALYAHLAHRQAAAIHAEQELLQLVRIVSSDHRQFIGGTRQLLGTLTRIPAVFKHDTPACSAFFADLLKQNSMYANLGAIEPGGNIFCSGLPMSRPINAADRVFFQRAVETRNFAVGEYQIGRITGEATINFGAPVLDETGQIQAAVFAALRLSWISQLIAKRQLPERARVVVIDRNGVILAHHPDPERWIGQSASGIPVTKIVLARSEGVVKATDREGGTCLYGFTSLHSAPNEPDLYVWIGVPESVVYAEVNHMLALNLTGLVIVGALVSVAAWAFSDRLILRRVRVLIEGTERLRAEDLERIQVTGRDEIATLASSFNDMTDRLQASHSRLTDQVKEVTRRERELNLFREIDQKILAEVPMTDILSTTIEVFTVLTEAKTCVLVRLDQQSSDTKSIAVYMPDLKEAQWSVVPMWLSEGEGAFGRAIATRAVVPMSDIAADPQMARYQDHLLALGVRALLTVPLCTEHAVLAVIGLGYSTVRTFPEAEVRAVQGLANQLTVALEQTRLREEERERWRLEEAARLKALFIANMSHELRTPLSSILGFSELLQDAAFGLLNDKQRRYVGHIHEAGTHLLALIEHILDLSKVEAGKIELRCEPVQLADALRSASELLRVQVVKKGITLTLQVEEGILQISADPVRLREILFNLLSNAVKFTPESGRITVTAKRVLCSGFGVSSAQPDATSPSECVEIAVTDTGIGLKPDDMPKLFQPFVRLDSALDAQIKGTGLGLALTKQLVELHGWQIIAASDGEGQGSTFTVRLPFVPQSVSPVLQSDESGGVG